MNQIQIVGLLIFFFSVILHEIAHGYSALYFGDDTAKRAGRLTLDPLAHVDLVGTIIIPAFCIMTGSPVFGWAKPVPVDFESLPHKQAELWVSLSGILVNFSLAVIAGLGVRILGLSGDGNSLTVFGGILLMTAYINSLLGIFNLLPVPPLDGWRIWGVWLPYEFRMQIEANAMFAMVLLFMLAPFLMRILVSPALKIIIWILTGIQI